MTRYAVFLLLGALSCGASLQNLAQIIAQTPNLRTISRLFNSNGLDTLLSGPGPFTVFGPADSGLLPLGPNILDFYSNPFNAALNDIVLTYHVAGNAFPTSVLFNNEKIATLDQNLPITVGIVGGLISINTARIIKANINASNGVLHIIDTVLVPSNAVALPTRDLITTVASYPVLSAFTTALTSAGLVPSLQCNAKTCNPFTVFAPTNAAFAKLPAFFMNYLLENPAQLQQVMNYHILNNRLYSTQIQNNLQINTLDEFTVVFVVPCQACNVLVNAVSNVTNPNIQTQNGALHVVDTVLIPNSIRTAFNAWRETLNSEAPQTNKSTPTFVPSPISSNTSLAEWVRSTPTLSTLWGAIYFADLIKLLLEGPGPFTLLAPNDEAFSKLPITYVEYLFSHSSTALSEVLAYQIFPFVLTLNSVGNGSNYATIEGQNVTATVVGNSTFFNNAQVTIANNIESNGIAHEINAVLLPVATSTVAPTASPTPTPTITFDWDRSSRRAGSRRHL